MTTAATVTGITVSSSASTLGAGGVVTFQLTLSQALPVTGGTPTLLLNDGGTATYTGGSGTNTLSFSYTAAAGQDTPDLAVVGMLLNGAAIGTGGGGFGAPITYATGAAPNALTVADFNHDGRPDIAVATAAGVSVLLADGHGGFGPATTIAGLSAAGIAAADMDGDGNTDLVIKTDAGVELLLGDGHGGFRAPGPFGPGTSTGAIAIGPIIPNGLPPDVVTGGSVLILDDRFNLPGGFTGLPITVGLALTVSGVALADLNGDGKLDIVGAANSQPGSSFVGGVAVVLSPGVGNPNHAVMYSAGSNPVAVAVADVNHDGKLDLVVADRDGSVAMLLGDGTGGYSFATTFAAGVQPNSISVADVNGDGNPDIIVADSLGGIDVLIGNGQGGFGAPTSYAAGSSPASVVVADVTGDGIPDLVAVNSAGVVVLPGLVPTGVTLDPGSVATAAGAVTGLVVNTKAKIVSISASAATGSLTAGQTLRFFVNLSEMVLISGGVPSLLLNDGGSAAYAGGSGSPTLTFSYTVQQGQSTTDLQVVGLATNGALIAAPTGNALLPAVTYPAGQQPVALTLADVNGDGKIDIVSTDYYHGVDVLLGNGAGAFSAPTSYRLGLGAFMTVVADLNHDGIPDLVVADRADGVDVLLGTGGGRFASPVAFATGTAPHGVAVADLNGDGNLDLITSGATPEILFGDGSGGFSAPVAYAGGATGSSVAALDLNGDGKPDLVVTNYGNYALTAVAGATAPSIPGSIVVLLNDGTGHFTSATTYALGLGPDTATTIRDVNGDGRPDLFNAGMLYLGNADGTFTLAANTFGAVSGPLADLNGDGVPDSITAGGVQYGKAGGGFGWLASSGITAASNAVATADLNGDGRPDIVTASALGVSVQLNNWPNVNTLDASSAVSAWGHDTGLAVVPPPDPLFDAAYYLAQNPDVAAAGVDPYQHYMTFGWKEGRNPDALFNTRYYLTQNPDVAAAGVNPLTHFETFGWREGRDPGPQFSDAAYLRANPDVAAAQIDPLLHYIQDGAAEGRMTFLVGGPGPADPLVDAALFNQQAGTTLTPAQATASYDATGWQAGLNPDALFDTAYYLSHNPDVAAAHIDPLLHYETYGWKEGRDPSAVFSTDKYLAAYSDVKAARIDPLLHYVVYGQAEGRAIFSV